jgi:hypothetical protein
LDPKDLLFDDALAFLRGNAGIDLSHVSHVSGSKSVPSESRFERSGGACLSPSYTSDWLFSKLRHLAILSNSIKPWPMTKTGKVTAVVAALHLYGNDKSSSIKAKAKISAKKTKLESKLKKSGLN